MDIRSNARISMLYWIHLFYVKRRNVDYRLNICFLFFDIGRENVQNTPL